MLFFYYGIYVWEDSDSVPVEVTGSCATPTTINSDNNGVFVDVSNNVGDVLFVEEGTTIDDIQTIIDDGYYDGIVGTGTERVAIAATDTLTLSRDFTFENVSLDGQRDENDVPGDSPIGINLSSSEEDISVSFINSELKNFGTAIMSNRASDPTNGLLTLTIEDSAFSGCYKGLYATNIEDLVVKNSTFNDMGAESAAPSNPDNPSIEDKRNRSGSAFDINQMSSMGNSIQISESTFTYCGDYEDTTDSTTSGAIKIKLRGNDGDTASDVPKRQLVVLIVYQ